MIDTRDIMNLVSPRVSRVLTIAEAALPKDQFRAFRKLVLDEFGRNGLEGELYEFCKQHRD
jgi:hypothetical protein